MITRVDVEFFKQFPKQSFALRPVSLLAGPNNSGKTTLLQAIMVWNLAMQKWWEKKGPDSGSRASERTGVAITRQEFTALPLTSMDQLWTDLHTAYRKSDQSNRKAGAPRLLTVTIATDDWELGFEFRYSGPEQVYVTPQPYDRTNADDTKRIERAHRDLTVVYVPPFSGIGVQETRYDRPYQNMLIGQGKAGDIVRNLLLELTERADHDDWDQLVEIIDRIFGCRLLDPTYPGAYIECRYQKSDAKNPPKLDISTAGSGFHQTLLILAFTFARPASVILLDEPDAHLHVILQKEINDLLLTLHRKRGGQMVIATHSEVLIDATAPDNILSFYSVASGPHILTSKTDRDRVREALKRVTSRDLLAAEHSKGVLYVESDSDFNLLGAWAEVLDHPLHAWFTDKPFWYDNRGCNPKEAKSHFFALRSFRPKMRGILLLDGDNRNMQDHDIAGDDLRILRWERYEAESYLLHPVALERFMQSATPKNAEPLFATAQVDEALEHLRRQMPPIFFDNPLDLNPYLKAEPASKTLLPAIFEQAGITITKPEYYFIARRMQPDEIAPEVKDKLDEIYEVVSNGSRRRHDRTL